MILFNSTHYDLLQSLLSYSAVNESDPESHLTNTHLKQFTPQLRFLLQHLVSHSFPTLPASPEFKPSAAKALANRASLPSLFP